MALKSKQKSLIVEITWLSIFGAIWLLGLVLAILGVVAYNLPSLIKNNPLYAAQKSFGKFLKMGMVDFRILGVIIIVVSSLIICAILQHYANKYDQMKAKIARREERRKKLIAELAAEASKSTEASVQPQPQKAE